MPLALPEWLAGTWAVERDINAGAGAFAGTATFAPAGDAETTRWQEDGRLTLGTFAGPAHRTLLMVATAPPLYMIRFAHGDPFHDLDLSAGEARAQHPCGPDLYSGV